MNKIELIGKAKGLNFPLKNYVILGSGPMCVRGIRESSDLDILVTEELFDKLYQKKEWKNFISKMGSLSLKSIDASVEIFKDFPGIENVDELIARAEIIDGLPFLNLDDLVKIKINMGREKDLQDIKLIEDFLKNK